MSPVITGCIEYGTVTVGRHSHLYHHEQNGLTQTVTIARMDAGDDIEYADARDQSDRATYVIETEADGYEPGVERIVSVVRYGRANRLRVTLRTLTVAVAAHCFNGDDWLDAIKEGWTREQFRAYEWAEGVECPPSFPATSLRSVNPTRGGT